MKYYARFKALTTIIIILISKRGKTIFLWSGQLCQVCTIHILIIGNCLKLKSPSCNHAKHDCFHWTECKCVIGKKVLDRFPGSEPKFFTNPNSPHKRLEYKTKPNDTICTMDAFCIVYFLHIEASTATLLLLSTLLLSLFSFLIFLSSCCLLCLLSDFSFSCFSSPLFFLSLWLCFFRMKSWWVA